MVLQVKSLLAKRTIYRWDLDKTYLRTEFDTVRDLLRTAFEKPEQKRSFPGASVLLRELRATQPAGIFILSGSPEQMRKVLEAKLRLDGIQWDSFTLKPSLRKLMRGKFRFLKNQVSYKLLALLESRVEAPPDTLEVLFGDDAEADAFIYSLYADLSAGRVGTETLLKVLERAQVYRDEIPRIVRLSARLPRGDTVRRIFIHLDRNSAPEVFTDFGLRVCPFYNYFQPALVLMQDGALESPAVLRVAADLILRHDFGSDTLISSFFDLNRRGYVGREIAEDLIASTQDIEPRTYGAAKSILENLGEQLRRKLPQVADCTFVEQMAIDYVDLFSRDKARARAAKRRARRKR